MVSSCRESPKIKDALARVIKVLGGIKETGAGEKVPDPVCFRFLRPHLLWIVCLG